MMFVSEELAQRQFLTAMLSTEKMVVALIGGGLRVNAILAIRSNAGAGGTDTTEGGQALFSRGEEVASCGAVSFPKTEQTQVVLVILGHFRPAF
ncbi:UNVERIFIED_CONTAM: hypothetical protein K2H54_032497 [Gekko kuhli]